MLIDINHLRQWIGRSDQASERLTPELVARFNATFDRQSGLAEGDAAPLLIHFCLCQPVVPTSELGPDGHPARGGFLPPVRLPRRMWAGGAFTFHDPLRIGDRVTRVSTIRNVEQKEGRSGALCFVTVEHEITAEGRKILSERQDIVYRDAPAPAKLAAAPVRPTRRPEPVPPGTWSRRIAATAPLLFRYSALTFNGHRIHYDAPYVTGVEGYPGLIVHGPMQATQLCQYAADLRGHSPARFSFRGLSPLFDGADYTLNAVSEGADLRLWSARIGGPVAMEAKAQWD